MAAGRMVLNSQVARQIRELIDKEFTAGQRLPAESELADRLGVSRATLREAIGVLSHEGLLLKKWGVGTIVLHKGAARQPGEPLSMPLLQIRPGPELIRDSGVEPGVSHVSVSKSRASDSTASLLGIEEGTEAWTIDRVLTADGQPLLRVVDFVPAVIKGREFDAMQFHSLHNPLITMLRDMVGCDMESVEGVLLAVGADSQTARLLGVPEGTPLLRAEQTSYTGDGAIVAFASTWYRSDKISLRFSRARGNDDEHT